MAKADSKPLVSAIITTHNRADLLPRALDSVIVQSYDNVEIIVVDDGSTDNTPEIMEKYREQVPVKYIRLDKSLGAPRARNRGIEASSGEFVAGLDDDDKWHKNRIQGLMAVYDDCFAAVTSDTVMVHSEGQARWRKKKIIDLDTLLYTNQVGNQVLVRRDRVLDVGGFDPDLKAAQDYDLWIRLCEKYGPIRNVQKPLQTIYMDHEEGRITSSSFQGYLQFYNKHKEKFDRSQRKYQLYKIRRAQQKPLAFGEFGSCVPAFRYWSEMKNEVIKKLWE
ncbi:glycosyltransferase [Fodinibius sp.]|uniref:glycosyltransferase n=1 Tax=Fodinibius sp. TaxID=1872440 RepID=UPI002ACE71A6|nr:glycosyltransferase [Fodinibius sp.]MDZ7658655.1 glycosyltransferase [Fodinibius sp.]